MTGSTVSLSSIHGVRAALARRPLGWALDVAAAAATIALGVLASLVLLAVDPPVASDGTSPAAGPLASALPWRPEATVFVTYGTPVADARALEPKLAALDSVASVRFVPRDEALAALGARGEAAAGGVLNTLKANPLPDAYVLRFGPAALPEQVEAAVAGARRLPRVDAVDFDPQAWRRAHHGTAVLRAAALVGGGCAALLLVALGVRLAGAGLPLEPARVRTLRLVGASERQLRTPALLVGALGFTVSSIGGWVMALILATLAAPRMAALAPLTGVPWTWPPAASTLPAGSALTLLAAAVVGACWGWVLAWLHLRRLPGP